MSGVGNTDVSCGVYQFSIQEGCLLSMAKHKHPWCKKSKAKSEAPISSNSYKRLKSVIFGGGQGPSSLLASYNARLITYKFQKVQSLTLDVQQFEHN